MTTIHASSRLVLNAVSARFLSRKRRGEWHERLRALAARRLNTPQPDVSVRISRYLRAGAGGRMICAQASARGRMLALRLKWCPDADPPALRATDENMRWWRARHPRLCGPLPELLDFWPDEQVLVMAECPGVPLSTCREAPELAVTGLGRWLREYAAGQPPYGDDLAPRLGATVTLAAAQPLLVDARPLLEQRFAAAERAAATMASRGLAEAKSWAARLDLMAMRSALSTPQPAGFIHGDFKPGNVLIHARDFAIVDWWIAPCVSWPLTDVATFAGNLWLAGTEVSQRIWQHFAQAYFPGGLDAFHRQMIQGLASMMCLTFLARQMAHPTRASVAGSRCVHALRRFFDPAASVGAFVGAHLKAMAQ